MSPVFLLLIVLCLTGLISYYNKLDSGYGSYTALRIAILETILLVSALIYFYTEIFSYFNTITTQSCTIFWSISCLISSLIIYGNRFQFRLNKDLASKRNINFKSYYFLLPAVSFFCVILPLLFLAIYVRPNNLDSNNYHLLRIINWIDNKNIGHFPTTHIQQLYHNVFAEYVVMQTMLLSGSDKLGNLPQFFAMIGSLAGISLIGKNLGFGYAAQLVCLSLLLFLPIGILESTTTQVDYIACFYFLCFIYFGYEIVLQSGTKFQWQPVVYLALSLSLAGFTKYTTLFFVFPFGVYFGVEILRKYGIAPAIKTATIVLVAWGLVFSPFFYRNYQLFGHVLSPSEDSVLYAEGIPTKDYSLAYTLASLSKNVGIHASLPNTEYNNWVDERLVAFHNFLGLELDDPVNTLNPYYTKFTIQEDFAPNTLHFLAIVVSLFGLLFFRKDRNIIVLSILSVIGFIILSTLVKYQPFASRTQMPFFALGCILITYLFFLKLKVNQWVLIMPFLLGSIMIIAANPNKMLVSLPYYSKKALGYLPRDICVSSTSTSKYQPIVSKYYDFEDESNCKPLKVSLPYQKRLLVFDKIDSLGFFNNDKNITIAAIDPIKAMYLSHLKDYDLITKLIPHFPNRDANIGVIYSGVTGYYHHLNTLESKLGHKYRMKYIYYSKEFIESRNEPSSFPYQYVLSDNLNLAKQQIDNESISNIYGINGLFLIKLRKVSSRLYTY